MHASGSGKFYGTEVLEGRLEWWGRLGQNPGDGGGGAGGRTLSFVHLDIFKKITSIYNLAKPQNVPYSKPFSRGDTEAQGRSKAVE